MCVCVFRPVLAPGEGEGGETPAKDSAGPPTCSTKEPQRGRHTDKGITHKEQDMMSLDVMRY